MRREWILAIDQGTTNTKAVLVDASGGIVARASRPLSVTYPRPAWVEQDPLELWRSVEEAVEECLGVAGGGKLEAVAVSNQRESIILWERATGRPAGPCVVWQCRRTTPFCTQLRERGLEPMLRERTGLTIDPLFSAAKARWLLDQAVDGRHRARDGGLCLGTVDSWVLWNLTGGAVHACDMTNASRTQLFNINRLEWDEELLDLFQVPAAALPKVMASSAIYGETVPNGRLPGGVPIAGMIGDSHGALFGHAAFQPGTVKATYGTGSSLMTPTAKRVYSGRGLSATIAWAADAAVYALEGNIAVTGAAVEWLGRLLGLAKPVEGIAELATGTADSGGVYLVPAFVGLGAPHWRESARGLISGLTQGATASHLARAAIESIAYQVRDVFDVMEAEAGARLQALLADGGASRNDSLMQFQADIIGRPVLRSGSAEVSALGAACLAGLATGFWPGREEIERLPRPRDRFEPRMAPGKRDELWAGWQRAVTRAMETASRS